MHAPRYKRAGFTMIELVTSLAVMSILMFGMASAIMLATRAIPSGQEPKQDVRRTATLLDELAEDLRVAEYITERTANAITFTVPDRDADGVPEVIRYAWSGTAGHALVRFHNGVPGASVLEDVHQFDLAYDLTSVVDTYEDVRTKGSEIELASHTTGGPKLEYHVQTLSWPGQYFEANLPADTVTWSVTRALLFAKSDGMDVDSGETLVQMRLADKNNLPTDTVLDEKLMLEKNLSSTWQWEQFGFTKVSGLAPDQGLCLVLECSADDHTARVAVDDGAGHVETINGGADWAAKPETLAYYVYGEAVTKGADRTLTRDYVTGVKIAARAGASPTSLVETTVQTLNMPEALTALWLADFEADPTLLDLDLDTTADWRFADDRPFAEGQRANGAWLLDGQLQTSPGYDFTSPTTVDIRLFDTFDNGEAGGVTMRVDRTGDTYAFIKAEIETDGSGGQRLTVSTYDVGLDFGAVVNEPGLPNDFVDVRILVDPAADAFNVRINDRDHGTYPYGRITAVTDRAIFLYETAVISGVKVDELRVRVGGTP